MPAPSASPTPPSVGLRRRLRLLLIVVGLFVSWAAYTIHAQELEKTERIRELNEMERRLEETRQKSEMLSREIERLNDPEYIGQIARQQGMGLPGEQLIRVEGADSGQTQQP